MKWEWEKLWLKAKTYLDKANELDHSQAEFPLWSALALELLARAALARIHPTLNADPTEPNNLLYALGYDIPTQPKSIPAHAVYLRLEKTVKGFGKAQRELCDSLGFLRNEELHSGELAFASLKESRWLPRFHEVCKVLCESLGKTLVDLVGDDVASAAEQLVATLSKEIESAVNSKIAAHAKVFAELPVEKQDNLRAKAEFETILLLEPQCTPQTCPACKSAGILKGELIKQLEPRYEAGALLVHQELLAIEFKCPACGLALHGPEEIAHSGIEPRFTRVHTADLHELFEPEPGEDYMNM